MLSGKKIMIVEDSPTIRYEVKLMLENTGASLVEAGNEIGMMNNIEEYGKCVDLILMDVTLKSENGLDLVKKLKSNKHYSGIPIIMLTEHGDSKHVLAAKELGVTDYLKKPVNKTDLISRLTKALG